MPDDDTPAPAAPSTDAELESAMTVLEGQFPDDTIILIKFPVGQPTKHTTLISDGSHEEVLPALQEIVERWGQPATT